VAGVVATGACFISGYYYFFNGESDELEFYDGALDAAAIVGSVGELLGHNLFAYCKNNVVNGKDPLGFRPIYTLGEETNAMREASYKAVNTAARNRSSNSSVGYIATGVTYASAISDYCETNGNINSTFLAATALVVGDVAALSVTVSGVAVGCSIFALSMGASYGINNDYGIKRRILD
jgi:hypothetical protein